MVPDQPRRHRPSTVRRRTTQVERIGRGRPSRRPPLELGHRAVRRARREAVVRVDQPGVGGQRLQHRLGVLGPVGRAVQRAARRQPGAQQRHVRRLDEPPLVVAGLRPRVGEEHVHRVQRARRAAGPDQLQRVARGPPARWSARAARPGRAGWRRPACAPRPPDSRGPGRRRPSRRSPRPCPEPISSTSGARRPNRSARSTGRSDRVRHVQAVRRPEPVQRVGLPAAHPAPARMEGADPGRLRGRGGGVVVGGGHSDPSVRDAAGGSDVMCARE